MDADQVAGSLGVGQVLLGVQFLPEPHGRTSSLVTGWESCHLSAIDGSQGIITASLP